MKGMRALTVGPALLLIAAGTASRGSTPQCEGWRLVLAPGSPVAGLAKVNALGLADFDRDGRPDLAAINGDPGELLILLNQGGGRFASPQQRGAASIGATASGLAITNVIAETAAPELIVCYHDRDEVAIFSTGNEWPWAAPRMQTIFTRVRGSPHVHNLAVGDINLDGHIDILIAQADDNAVVWALGDGAGRFAPAAEPFAAGRHPYTIIAADFNNDGHLDFASPNAGSNDLTVGLGDGAGRFTAPPGSRPRLPPRSMALAAGDINGDGMIDLVASSDGNQRELALLLGDGRGAFMRTGHPFTAPGRCYGQVVADVNGDGLNDVVAPSIDRASVIVWLAEDPGALRFRRMEFATPGTDSQVLAICDINHDGLPDAIAAGWERPTISVLLGERQNSGLRVKD